MQNEKIIFSVNIQTVNYLRNGLAALNRAGVDVKDSRNIIEIMDLLNASIEAKREELEALNKKDSPNKEAQA